MRILKKLKKLLISKRCLVLLMIFVILGSLVPLKFARADVADWIAKGFRVVLIGSIDVVAGLQSIVFMVIQGITGVATFTAAEFLKAVINMSLEMPLTPASSGIEPGDAVLVGWQFTRAIANMAMIIILAWIAFATILRIRTYQVKTLLPKLLIIALLINFIPVITGVIIDITNIITEYFSDKALAAANWFLANPIKSVIDTFGEDWKKLIPSKGGWTGIAVQGLIGIIFNLMVVGLTLGYALVFLIRIAAIWILIIMAPLFWLGYIVPAGKKYWNMWWNQFILWSIIGIPLLFFLYIAGTVLAQGMTKCTIDLEQYGVLEGIIAENLTPMLCNSYAFIVAIIILIVGIGIAMALLPRGAVGIVNFGRKATGWAKRGVVAGAGKLGKRVTKGAEQKTSGWRQSLEKRKEKATGRLAWAKRLGLGALAAGASGLQTGAAELTSRIEEGEKEKTEAAKAKTKGKSKNAQIEFLRRIFARAKKKVPGADEEVIGAMEQMLEDGNLADAEEAGIFKEKGYRKYVAMAWDRGRKDLARYKPELAVEEVSDVWKEGKRVEEEGTNIYEEGKRTGDYVKELEGAAREGEGRVQQQKALDEFFEKMKPSDIPKMSEESLMKDQVKKSIVNVFDGKQMGEVGRSFGRAIVDGIQKEIATRGTTPAKFQDFAKKNPSLSLWLYGNTAQDLGFSLPEAATQMTREELREEVRSSRVGAETERQQQITKIKTQSRPILVRTYHRKETQGDIKELIKGIFIEEGLRMPLQSEVKRDRVIRKLEKEYNKLTKEYTKADQARRDEIDVRQKDIKAEEEPRLKKLLRPI